MTHTRAIGFLLVWLVGATIFVAVGGLQLRPPPFPQLVLVGLVGVLAGAHAGSPAFRAFMLGLPPAWLVGLHVSRFVGAYFLVLYDQGRLPYAFAVLGGWGDIIVAAGAVVLLVVHRGAPPIGSLAVQVWNLIGLVDILYVVSTAARSALAEPSSMQPLVELPLGLLPAFLVPLIIFTHAVVLHAGMRGRRTP